MSQVALTIGQDGAIPQDPQTIRDNLVAYMQSVLPDYTADLPKSLIEDMTSTVVAALSQCDQSYIELINSISPTQSNLAILTQQAIAAGILGMSVPSRTSVYVVFSGVAGYVIPKGMIVGDSTYQYEVQESGVIGAGGLSSPLYAIATQDGTWSVPAGQVNQIATSIPTGYTLTVTNPNDGIPSGEPETVSQFRARVLRSWTHGGMGMATYLKQLLYQVQGVQQRLVSVRQQTSGMWSVICGGGDPYEVANAIFTALFDISALEGSATTARNITVDLYDYPDIYQIVFISPPEQTVAITITWNTSSPFLVSESAVNSAANPVVIDYINSIPVGKPINLLTLGDVFKESIKDVLDPELLTRLVFAVSIDGSPVSVAAGTHIIESEAESYFYAAVGSITINQG